MRHQRFSSRALAGLALVLTALAAGCGGPKNKIVPVEGKILFGDGKPLPAGTRLIFNPGQGGTGTATGITEADGSFKVTHVSGRRGAEVGTYAILLAAPEGERESFVKIVPEKYREGGVLSMEVKEGMPPLELRVTFGDKVTR